MVMTCVRTECNVVRSRVTDHGRESSRRPRRRLQRLRQLHAGLFSSTLVDDDDYYFIE